MNNIDVIVIIATSMQRTDLLIDRALPSVYAQASINPVCIYIVDDNEDPAELRKIKRRVKRLRHDYFSAQNNGGIPQGYFHTRVMRNSRTKGHSGAGAWNTAAMHAYRHHARGRKTYIALLDDDDTWDREYLSRCVDSIKQSDQFVPAVISGFYRRQASGDKVTNIKPSQLTQDAFFVGNPGWQGSNTFVELSTFWKAGGFDESMLSTHDRDFAIRFLDVCEQESTSINVINESLMWHYVHSGQRVTTCPKRKAQGLDCFYDKYQPRMTVEVLAASLERASKLFSYRRCDNEHLDVAIDTVEKNQFENEKPVKIIIGVVSSDSDNIKRQMRSLNHQIALEQQFAAYCDYVVMTNGDNEVLIEREVAKQADGGLNSRCINISEQHKLYSQFPFKSLFEHEPLEQKSIAHSRSLLQFYCWKLAQTYHKECMVLILDDDLTFEAVTFQGDQLVASELNFLGKLARLSRVAPADMLISGYTDAPPLPFYSSMRTQLVDVLYSLRLFLRDGMETEKYPNVRNLSDICKQDDYYYDLSSARFDHLERPVYWQGIVTKEPFGRVSSFKQFLKDICCLEREANITRPLMLDSDKWSTLAGADSYKRGGVAIYLDLQLLIDVPNLSPCMKVNGRVNRTRRSDFIAGIAMSEIYGKRVKEVAFPLRHNRRIQNKPCHISANKLADDVVGLCFYRAFKYKLSQENISDRKLKAFFNHSVRECLGKLKVNNLRVLQLLEQLKALMLGNHSWWNRTEVDAELSELLDRSIQSLNFIQHEFAKRSFNQQIKTVKKSIASFDLINEIDSIYQTYQSLSALSDNEVAA